MNGERWDIQNESQHKREQEKERETESERATERRNGREYVIQDGTKYKPKFHVAMLSSV